MIVTMSPIAPAMVKTRAMPRSGPMPNQLPMATAPALAHEGDDDELRKRPDEERRERRGRLLDRLSETEDAALALKRHYFLQCRVLRRFRPRPAEHPDEEACREQPD